MIKYNFVKWNISVLLPRLTNTIYYNRVVRKQLVCSY